VSAGRLLQRGVVRLLTSAPLAAVALPHGGLASIFMLHRFGGDVNGHDPVTVRRLFQWLRSRRFEVLDLEQLFRRLAGEGAPIRRAVAFTIDDGYFDQAELAAPLFAEYGVPVTTFLATGFLDGALWLWWDKIEYLLQGTPKTWLEIVVSRQPLTLDLGNSERRRMAAAIVAERCKALPEAERLKTIEGLAEAAGVPLPGAPPPRYRPMTWDMVRRCEAGGMRFGPHTVTHPILARTDDAQAQREIEASWERVAQEVARPMPVFCYPNGKSADFGLREYAILRGLGFLGALSAEPGYAIAQDLRQNDGAFRVPRFSFSDAHDENLRYASRLEWLWQRARGT